MKIPAPVLALVVMFFAANPAAAQAAQPAKVFRPAIAQIENEVEVPILLPSTLPAMLRERDISVARGIASAGGYTIELRYKGVAGNAGFAALFAGTKGGVDIHRPMPGTHRSRLANGIDAIVGPVSCGGSCAPANLWWAQNGVTYQIQIKLRSDAPEMEQEMVLLATANAMVRVPVRAATPSPSRLFSGQRTRSTRRE